MTLDNSKTSVSLTDVTLVAGFAKMLQGMML
jgi:hypothetical protein